MSLDRILEQTVDHLLDRVGARRGRLSVLVEGSPGQSVTWGGGTFNEGGPKMKNLYTTISILVAFLAVSPTEFSEGASLKFRAALSGAQEVTTPAGGVATDTAGEIRVGFNEALSEVDFRLVVRDGMGVTQAHFHCGRPGENGPIMVFLFGLVPAGVTVDGELARGTRTNADFTGADCVPAIGRPVNNIASLFFAARDGLIYANVHTLDHPAGEIRGQLVGD